MEATAPSETAAEPTAEKTHILFVDDEPSILRALKRVFHREKSWECHFSDSPKAALEVLSGTHVSVIVSDHRMPIMEGAEFLARVKEKRPNTVRIMLTGQANMEDVQKAVNAGEIFRFVLKPWNDDDLREVVRSAVEYHRISDENRRLTDLTTQQNDELKGLNEKLEERVEERTHQLSDALYTAQNLNEQLEGSLSHVVKVLFALIEAARPDLGVHSRRVAECAVALGHRLNFDQRRIADLEVAALMHDVGKLGMPSYMIGKSVTEYTLPETEIYHMHPTMGAEFLQEIPRFADVSKFILAHHERVDGSGFPRSLRESAIPRESLIIGLADRYVTSINRICADTSRNYNKTYQEIADLSGRAFPGHIVNVLLEYMSEQRTASLGADATKVGINDLAPNMVLVENVYTVGGSLLVSGGTRLEAKAIGRIRSIAQVDPVAGEIYVTWDKEHRATRSI